MHIIESKRIQIQNKRFPTSIKLENTALIYNIKYLKHSKLNNMYNKIKEKYRSHDFWK